MGRDEERIASLIVLLFLIIVAVDLFFKVVPFLIIVLLAVGIVTVFVVLTWYYWTRRNLVFPLIILKHIWSFILSTIFGKSSRKNKVSRDKTPPLSQGEKDRIINDVAKGVCQHPNCNREDNLEVHHIVPRSEGGRNTFDNLIVLCPTHHAMADKGSIPRSRLKYMKKNN
jgi:hypothetical protein